MIWTSYPILYSQINEILHDLDELFLFSSNSKTQTLFDHFVVFYKKIRVSDKNIYQNLSESMYKNRVSDKNMHKNLSEGGCEN